MLWNVVLCLFRLSPEVRKQSMFQRWNLYRVVFVVPVWLCLYAVPRLELWPRSVSQPWAQSRLWSWGREVMFGWENFSFERPPCLFAGDQYSYSQWWLRYSPQESFESSYKNLCIFQQFDAIGNQHVCGQKFGVDPPLSMVMIVLITLQSSASALKN